LSRRASRGLDPAVFHEKLLGSHRGWPENEPVPGDLGRRVRERFERFGVAASDEQVARLEAYFGLLAKWNRTVNLTALSLDPPSEKALDRLFVEPFLAAGILTSVSESRVREDQWALPTAPVLLDVGSGGGSPAIPLAIALPGCRLRMVEAKSRKSAFLREAVRQVELARAEVLTARLEELAAVPEMRESADVISIRAVRADPALWDVLSSFAKPDASVLWFRTRTEAPAETPLPRDLRLVVVAPLIQADGSELAILRRSDSL
jgi:16S rRNA (guanine527-N7)-methyltransferase